MERRCRVSGHGEVDVAVIKGDFGENEGFPALAGMTFREPRWQRCPSLRISACGWDHGPGDHRRARRCRQPRSESPAMGGYPRQKIFMTSAIQRPGNSGGPIAAADGRVVGLVIEHTRGGVERAGAQGVERGESSSESSPFYHGIPAGEVVRAIAETGFNDLVVLEDPA